MVLAGRRMAFVRIQRTAAVEQARKRKGFDRTGCKAPGAPVLQARHPTLGRGSGGVPARNRKW